jgi:hypothetical protein
VRTFRATSSHARAVQRLAAVASRSTAVVNAADVARGASIEVPGSVPRGR